MSTPLPTDPVILPYAEMQKKAERDGVDIMVYVNSMHAHVQRQRDEINRLHSRLNVARNIITDVQNFIHPSSVWRDVDLMQNHIDRFLKVTS